MGIPVGWAAGSSRRPSRYPGATSPRSSSSTVIPRPAVSSSSVSSERPRWPRSACEIALAETPARRARSACERPRWRRTARSAVPSRAAAGARSSSGRPPFAGPASVDASLDADGAALGLGDPQTAVADDDDALRHVLDRAPHRLEALALRQRPVGDRPDLEQHRAAVDEEAAGAVDAPAVGHRVERVEDEQVAPVGPARPPHGVEERGGAVERAPVGRVDRLEPSDRRACRAGRAPRSRRSTPRPRWRRRTGRRRRRRTARRRCPPSRGRRGPRRGQERRCSARRCEALLLASRPAPSLSSIAVAYSESRHHGFMVGARCEA